MNEIANIRMQGQQLSAPQFDEPADLVSWMGAMQAQDYNMMKWAIGLRLKSGTIEKVESAISRGEILRTHVMRPTWHIVAAEDIRWMIGLSAKRIKAAMISWRKDLSVTEKLLSKTTDHIIKILEGNNSLTRQEIGEGLSREGIATDTRSLYHFLSIAEAEGIICSGVDKGRLQTYALIDERVPPTKTLHREEALAKLAHNYFRSHSPASITDFTWWSGLSATEAKQAISFIEKELSIEKFAGESLYIHQSCYNMVQADEILHLMPPFDEYLISYKDRTHALPLHHYPKAFTNNGIFYPVIMRNGRIIGNWKKSVSKEKLNIETSFFEKGTAPDKKSIKKAEQKYKLFLQA